MTTEPIRAVYRVMCPESAIGRRAEEIAREQTTELPRGAVVRDGLEEEVLGRVARIRPVGRDLFDVDVDLPGTTQDGSATQLVNVLFGNSSMQADTSLHDVRLPGWLVGRFAGPRHGIAGLRALTGVQAGALSCTALKPQGLATDELASLAGLFARAGIDVIKDDHGLSDQEAAPFAARVAACRAAVARAAAGSGREALYVPNVSGSPAELARRTALAREAGCRAVMVAPSLVGLPAFDELVRAHPDLAVVAHPSFAGSVRIAPRALLGRLYRLLGADAVIFPHAGGRFGTWTEDACLELAERLRAPWLGLAPALPVPAGGMEVERAGELRALYGDDVMLLVGGSLYKAGDDLEARARAFAASVRPRD